jgi:hypothetical protein
VTPDERAWWLLGCALAALVAAEVCGMCIEDDDPRSCWDIALTVALLAAAVLACGAMATMATAHPY